MPFTPSVIAATELADADADDIETATVPIAKDAATAATSRCFPAIGTDLRCVPGPFAPEYFLGIAFLQLAKNTGRAG